MSYVTYTLLLFAALLGCLAATGLRAEDTYNFYFQKAPGPVTVNQGGSGPAPKATDPEKAAEEQKAAIAQPAAPAAAQPAPAASSANVVATDTEPSRGYRPFEFSLGLAGSSSTDPNAGSQQYYGNAMSGQIVAGLQYNVASWLGIQAEGYYLKGERKSRWNSPYSGSRLDYAANLVLTPFRLRVTPGLAFTISALGGWGTVPYEGFNDIFFEAVEHKGTAHAGARLGFEVSERLALQASLKHYFQIEAPTGTVALALLF